MQLSPQFQRYQSICPDWQGFLECLQRPLPTTFWVNTRLISSSKLFECLPWPQLPIAWRPDAYRIPFDLKPGRQPEYMAGFYHLQEEVSMLPPTLLDPLPGEKVLDLCAAPGNKTMQIALAMNNSGTLIANDWSHQRLKVLHMHASRLGMSNLSTTVSHGAHLQAPPAYFDRILVDVPCSCEGTLRKNPSILEHTLEAGRTMFGGVQISLLKKAVDLCRPGGRIVYSTCTFRPEENEYVINRILRLHANVRVRPVSLPGLVWQEGLTHWEGQSFDPSLRHSMRLWPHMNDTGGFYVAVLEKDA